MTSNFIHKDDNVDLFYHWMCSYLYSVCLVSHVLKNIHLKEDFSVVVSKYSLSDMEKTLRSLNHLQCLKIVQMEKAWFMISMEYSRNGKGIMVPIENTLIFYTPIEKGWFSHRLLFKVVIVMVKYKKYSIKDTISIKISLYIRWSWQA